MQIQGAFYNGPCWQILLIPALNSLYKRQLVGDTLDRDHIFKVISDLELGNTFCKDPVWDHDGSLTTR